MAFPTSPTNGQQANINGITYTYSSAATAWTVSTSVSNTFVSINVSANVNSANVLATGVISATGNVSGGNLVVTGNIVDTGALTIVTGSNGNITLSPDGTGIVAATGAISTTGNISANNATFTSNQTLSYGTANGVAYLNGSKVLTTGSALVFDGTNLGLGVTPSVQYSGIKSLQIGATTNLFDNGASTKLYHNAYTAASGDDTYLTTGYAQGYLMPSNGQHIWYTSASGTAGNPITFTQAMTLDASGRLGIGTATMSTSENLVVSNGTVDLVMSPGAFSSGNVGMIGTKTNHALAFAINTAQKMAIDTSGRLLVGTASAFNSAYTMSLAVSGSTGGLIIKPGSDNYTAIGFFNAAGSTVGSISCSSTTTTYSTSSDYRLKNTITPITGALAKVALLKPVNYKWNIDGSDSQGFIAHELQAVVPECVTGEKDAVETQEYEISPAVPATFDKDGNVLTPAVKAVMDEREVPKYQGIDTSFLVATLTAAIQEQQALITTLTARISALENA